MSDSKQLILAAVNWYKARSRETIDWKELGEAEARLVEAIKAFDYLLP